MLLPKPAYMHKLGATFMSGVYYYFFYKWNYFKRYRHYYDTGHHFIGSFIYLTGMSMKILPKWPPTYRVIFAYFSNSKCYKCTRTPAKSTTVTTTATMHSMLEQTPVLVTFLCSSRVTSDLSTSSMSVVKGQIVNSKVTNYMHIDIFKAQQVRVFKKI